VEKDAKLSENVLRGRRRMMKGGGTALMTKE